MLIQVTVKVEGLKWEGGVHIYTRTAVLPIPKEAEQYETLPE
jgi:hypothetical protein